MASVAMITTADKTTHLLGLYDGIVTADGVTLCDFAQLAIEYVREVLVDIQMSRRHDLPHLASYVATSADARAAAQAVDGIWLTMAAVNIRLHRHITDELSVVNVAHRLLAQVAILLARAGL